MPRMLGRFCAVVIILSISCIVSRADVIFGGNARDIAMGGAGVAIVDKTERSTQLNPAALALFNRRVRVAMLPNVGLRVSGVPLRAAYEHLFGNPDQNDAVSLARDFGSKNSEFGVGLGWGARIGHMDARVEGTALARILPNTALQTWSKNANGDTTQLTGNERADMLGAAVYSLPTVGIAERISPGGSPILVEAGTRIKLQRAIYSHYIVSSANIANNTAATPAPELNGGTTITKDGIGVDFGLLAHPRNHSGFSAAIVVINLIEPRFVFNGTDQNGAAVKYDFQPRSMVVGSAYESGRLLFAADAVDLTRAYGNVQGRIGAEYKTRGIALRAGYASARGFTVGFGWGYFDIAFGARAPLGLSQTLRF
jgi:hypothetical protein